MNLWNVEKDGETDLVEAETVSVNGSGCLLFFDRNKMVCGYGAEGWVSFERVE